MYRYTTPNSSSEIPVNLDYSNLAFYREPQAFDEEVEDEASIEYYEEQ